MTGNELKQIILSKGISLTEMSRRLEISPQHLNQALSAADIKSGLIEKVSKAIDTPIASIYGEPTTASKTSNKDVAVLEERINGLEKLLEEKERTIILLIDQKNA